MSSVGATLYLAPRFSTSRSAPKYVAMRSGGEADTNLPHMAQTVAVRSAGWWLGAREPWRPLLAVRGEPFAYVGPTEPQELEAERGVEDRAGVAVPVVERVLGPPQRGLR